MYYTIASSTTPTSPAGSSFDFSTASFATITANWGTTFSVPSTADTAGKQYWAVRYSVSEATFQGTQTISFSPPFVWTNFDGLVTFTNLAAGKDGTGTVSKTLIDGASIKTGSITTNSLTVTGFGDSAILNASFEEADATDSTMPAKWVRGSIGGTQILTGYNTNGSSSSTVYRDTSNSYSGTASLVLYPGAGNSASVFSESIPVAGGDVWYVSARCKNIAGTGASSLYVRIVKDGAAGAAGVAGVTYTLNNIEGVNPGASWQPYSGQAEIPAGWTKARIMIMQWTVNTGAAIAVDEIEWKKATGAAQISSINADSITVGTLTADRIRFTNVGNNVIFNSSCATGKDGWINGDDVGGSEFRWIGDIPSWTNVYTIAPYNGSVQNWYGTFASGTVLGWQGMPNENRNGDLVVSVGDRVELSVYVMNHRCTASIRLGLYNAANDGLGEIELATSGTNNFESTGRLTEWTNLRIGGFYDIPATVSGQVVSHCKWWVYAFANSDTATSGNPYQFVCLPFLSKASKNQTQLTAWSEGTKNPWTPGTVSASWYENLYGYTSRERIATMIIPRVAIGDIIEVFSKCGGFWGIYSANHNVLTGSGECVVQSYTQASQETLPRGGGPLYYYNYNPVFVTKYRVITAGRFWVQLRYTNYNDTSGTSLNQETIIGNYIWSKRQ